MELWNAGVGSGNRVYRHCAACERGARAGSCHSADYVTTQPPQMGADFWRAIVFKMVKAYHAPVSHRDAAVIVDYLSHTY